MIRTALKYHRPHTFAEASEILAAHRDKVAIVAGAVRSYRAWVGMKSPSIISWT